MGKTPAAATNKPLEEQNKSVAATVTQLPTELLEELKGDAGKGVSNLQRDNIIPMIYVLQALSPQVNKRNASFIDGAETGAIWLRNSNHQIVSGDAGIAFQPCHYNRDIVEWIDRDSGGGFVARHKFLTPDESMEDAVKRLRGDIRPSKKEGSKRIEYWLGSHELKETRYHAGYVHGGYFGLEDAPGLMLPYVIPLSGSGHQVSREWMFAMNQHQFPGNPDRVLPSMHRLYRLRTKARTNSAGQEWSMFTVSDDVGVVPGFPTDLAVYRRGVQLHDAIERGEKQAEAPVQGDDGEGGGAQSREERAERAEV